MPTVRRLTAILAADVAGYSRLMGEDEEGTHERLKAHLRELIEPKIAEHRGRIVKNTGDGFLAEFASVVDAVRCAVEMQRGMAERNAPAPPEKRIEFRIGVNLQLEEILTPAVSVRRSVGQEYAICLDCGYRGKTLRRHITMRHGLSRDEYLKRWGLRTDHPLTAPAYSERRSTMAKALGFGRKPKAQAGPAVTPTAAPAADADGKTQATPTRRRQSRSASKPRADASEAVPVG